MVGRHHRSWYRRVAWSGRPWHVDNPMSDIVVHHLSPQEFVEFELNSRETMRVRIAYLGQVPDTDKASLGVEITYATELEAEDEGQ